MRTLTKEIEKNIELLNPFYQKEVYDFVKFLQEKQKRNDDTEYLSGIPGMVDSILEEGEKPVDEYSKELDW